MTRYSTSAHLDALDMIDALNTKNAASESVLDETTQKLIAAHARVRQLEVEHTADQITIDALRTQRDDARHDLTLAKQAGSAFVAKFHDADRELAESRELVRAQALSLEELANKLRRSELALSKLERTNR